MNRHYISTIVEYIDANECSFQYQLPDLDIDEESCCLLPFTVLTRYSPHWRHLSAYAGSRALEVLVSDYPDKIDWEALVSNPNADEAFWHRMIRRFPDRVQWISLACTVGSDAFWELYICNVSASWLAWNDHLSTSFWETYPASLPGLSSAQPPAFWTTHDRWKHLDWHIASTSNKQLDASFWLWLVSVHPEPDYRCLSTLSPGLPLSFWERRVDRIHWRRLCEFNLVLPLSFWEEHLDRIDWAMLAHNRSIPLVFFQQHRPTRLIQFRTSLPFEYVLDNKDEYDDTDFLSHPGCDWRLFPDLKSQRAWVPRIVNELVEAELSTFLTPAVK